MRRIPNFILLRTFESAARLESFSAAAAELNLTPSAVSHQIKELENHLQRPLFKRIHRGVAITPDGIKFARSLGVSFDAIERAWNELVSPHSSDDLTLHCAPSFATNWIGRRIRSLIETHPQMRLSILSDAEPLDLVKRIEIDVVVSYCGYLQRDEIYTIPLGMDAFVPMCAPALRDRFSSDEETILKSTPIESRGSCISWSAWYGITGLKQPPTTALTFDRLSMKISAAVDGLGVVLESSGLASEELASGKLVKLDGVAKAIIPRESHYISVRKRDLESEKITAFISWLKDEWRLNTPIVGVEG
jgi:LysR family transcriptional regulator, glycine cleavage system transcriptional activator